MNERQTITFQPIGHVENDVTEMLPPEEIASRRSRIVIHPSLAEGLLGIEESERLLIVYYFDRAQQVRMQLHPRDDESRPLRGVFATRTQYRPNPIGVTVARLLAVEDNVLVVEGLDAMSGTLVLDVKPFAPAFDTPDQAGA